MLHVLHSMQTYCGSMIYVLDSITDKQLDMQGNSVPACQQQACTV